MADSTHVQTNSSSTSESPAPTTQREGVPSTCCGRAGADWDERVLRARCRCEGDWRPGLRLRPRGGTAGGEEKWVLRITDGLGSLLGDSLYLEVLVRELTSGSSRPFFPHPGAALHASHQRHRCTHAARTSAERKRRRSPGILPSATRSRSARSRRSMSACIGSIATMGTRGWRGCFMRSGPSSAPRVTRRCSGTSPRPISRRSVSRATTRLVLDGQSVLVTLFVDGSAPNKGLGTTRRLADLLGQMHALPLREAILPGGALHHVPAYEGLPGREIASAASLLDDIDDCLTGDRRRGFKICVNKWRPRTIAPTCRARWPIPIRSSRT